MIMNDQSFFSSYHSICRANNSKREKLQRNEIPRAMPGDIRYSKGQRPNTGVPCPFGAKNRYIVKSRNAPHEPCHRP